MTVFEFEDYRAYLNHVRIHYPGRKKPITLDQWAKKLGYRSPRSIAMVLKGQRLPSPDLVLALSGDLQHSETERRYFELLVRKQKYHGNLPKPILEELQHLNPRLIRHKPLDAELFSYVSSWHNFAIMQLFQTPDFRDDPKWIAKRLRSAVTPEDVQASLDLLERLKIIERETPGGKLRLSMIDPLITMEDIPSAAVRKHHMDQMDQAKLALQSQPMLDREFTCLTLRTNRARLPEMKKMIREFRDKFEKEFFTSDSADVCQLNVQFFFHTAEDKK